MLRYNNILWYPKLKIGFAYCCFYVIFCADIAWLIVWFLIFQQPYTRAEQQDWCIVWLDLSTALHVEEQDSIMAWYILWEIFWLEFSLDYLTPVRYVVHFLSDEAIVSTCHVVQYVIQYVITNTEYRIRSISFYSSERILSMEILSFLSIWIAR